MAAHKKRDVVRALEVKLGCKTEEGDHTFFLFYLDGKLAAHTKVSHNTKDIDDYLIGKMAKQMHATKVDFVRLVACTYSKEEYEQALRALG